MDTETRVFDMTCEQSKRAALPIPVCGLLLLRSEESEGRLWRCRLPGTVGPLTRFVSVTNKHSVNIPTHTALASLSNQGWASPAESQVVIVKCFKGLLL
jgi:hypothetical protein